MRWNLAASLNGPLGVRAVTTDAIRVKALLQVVDLHTGEFLREFPIRWEPGWRMSMCRDGVHCVVGAYESYGVAVHDLRDGSEVWRRKDLKAIQVVTTSESDDLVFCGREAKAAHLLDCRTGESVRTFRGVYTLWPSPYDSTCLLGTAKLELHHPLGTRLAIIPRTKGGDEIAIAFSPDSVVVSEHHGTFRCIDILSGSCRWTYTPTPDRHVEQTAFMEKENAFLAYERRYYDHKPPNSLLHFDPRTGVILKRVALGSFELPEFCLGGTAMFDSSGLLISTATGRLLRTLAFSSTAPN